MMGFLDWDNLPSLMRDMILENDPFMKLLGDVGPDYPEVEEGRNRFLKYDASWMSDFIEQAGSKNERRALIAIQSVCLNLTESRHIPDWKGIYLASVGGVVQEAH